MTYQDIANIVAEIGLSYAYYQFPVNEAPSLPYVVYFYPNRDDFVADNSNYGRVESCVIELYTETKDLEQERAVETVLDKYHLVYDKNESFINKENMYESYYEFEVFIDKYETPIPSTPTPLQ